jgi:hypothetical protein
MSSLRQLIKEHLLLEKKIAQIMTSISIQYAFEVDRTHHAYERRTRTDIVGYNQKEISNSEIKYILELSLKQIAEKIAEHEIVDETKFVVKSVDKEIAITMTARHVDGTFWRLVVNTVFRESYDIPFRTGKYQTVIWLD